jgi:hypothetical protein
MGWMMVTAADAIETFLETLGYKIGASVYDSGANFEVYKETESGFRHISSIVLNDLIVVCSPPGYSWPEYKFDLYDPDSLPGLQKALEEFWNNSCGQST